ncbi:Armadillo-like helical [Artemisia annua]|uniref:Armadillo-like helical n=1 Tax=Artemisia annua TaxID=35608 RepID=A0A2U1KTI1_ARTAN|nr:Armadillo-like helical [Artemisia annua]
MLLDSTIQKHKDEVKALAENKSMGSTKSEGRRRTTIATASKAFISCVLKFIENLLNLDIDTEGGATDVKGILHPNIDLFVYSLHHLFTCKSTNKY